MNRHHSNIYPLEAIRESDSTEKPLLSCRVEDPFLEMVDKARGFKSRSTFLREALFYHIKNNTEFEPDKKWTLAASRCGKGGRRRKSPAKQEVVAAKEVTTADIISGPWGQ